MYGSVCQCPWNSYTWFKMQVLRLGCLASIKYLKNIFVKEKEVIYFGLLFSFNVGLELAFSSFELLLCTFPFDVFFIVLYF